MIHWWRRRTRIRAELEQARRAEEESAERVKEARGVYRDALTRAHAAKRINARNHFSENLAKAFGG